MSRGLYSPNGAHPQELPDYWRFEDGTVRTDLPDLSDEQLRDLGWFGPIDMPPTVGTSYYTHDYEWNSETLSYDATEVDEFEKERRVDYQRFWNLLLDTSVYTKIKSTASQSLSANTLVTEFIALLTDAKMNSANKGKIQQILLEIITNISFSSEELQELQEIFLKSGMSSIYTLTP